MLLLVCSTLNHGNMYHFFFLEQCLAVLLRFMELYILHQRKAQERWSVQCGALVNFGINLFLIPVVGIQAASLSTFVAYLVTWIVRIKHVTKLAKIRLMPKNEAILTILVLFQAVLLIVSKSGIFLYISQVLLALVVTFFERKIIFMKNNSLN